MNPSRSQKTSQAMVLNTALQYHRSGDLAQAESLYREILSTAPAHAEALHLLGVLCHQRGDHEAAVELIGKAVRIDSRNPAAFNHLGVSYRAAGQPDEAEKQFRRSIKLDPEQSEAHYNLGNALVELKRHKEAERAYRQAIQIRPDYAEAYCNLGSVLKDLSRNLEAEEACRTAIRIRPEYAKAHYNLGNALAEQERLLEAVEAFKSSLHSNPSFADAWHNLGIVLVTLGRLHDAESVFRSALSLDPDHSGALNSLGNLLAERGERDQAIECLRRAVAVKPDHYYALGSLIYQLQNICSWDESLEIGITQLRAAVRNKRTALEGFPPPHALTALPTATATEQKLCAGRWADKQYAGLLPLAGRAAAAGDRIQIGYLSADFHDHVVAQHMVEIFEKHDRCQFTVSAYACGPDDGSSMRKRLAAIFDRFVDISSLSMREAARIIQADGIDILVDLTGYTKNERMAIMAYRPAPVQVGFLGYPGTSGASFMDYLIADRFIIPPENEKYYSEKILRLPDCYMPNDSLCPRPEAPGRLECGLPENGIVWCCFNQFYKITAEMFDVWCRLLNEVPDSVLWLRSFNKRGEDNLRSEAEKRGVSAERIVFDPFVTREEHYARLQCADIFLDTNPYNAHATCSDALWAGVPVATLTGETFASRVAGSLLTVAGVPELISYSVDEYFATALALATDHIKRAEVRARILAARETSPLFDSELFTRNLEALYLEIFPPRPVRG